MKYLFLLIPLLIISISAENHRSSTGLSPSPKHWFWDTRPMLSYLSESCETWSHLTHHSLARCPCNDQNINETFVIAGEKITC
jgi:hypothetical protein